MNKTSFKYIDLFCGIGGFHQAMQSFGGECVFAAEIDKDCIEVYRENYGINAAYDMTKVEVERIPRHDVLCGGFPCQAFSKAGKQAGVNDTRGTLFFEIERVLRYHHPQFILLENVRNLVSHDNGKTWAVITGVLRDIGYRLTAAPLVLSPHQFGVPQLRERVYIVGKYDPQHVEEPLNIEFDNLKNKKDLSIYSILEEGEVSAAYNITKEENRVLTAWDEFYQGIDAKVIGFPVNTNYFKYADDISSLPEWKQGHITRNKELYQRNKAFIDKWLRKWNNLDDFTPTQHKFEWQCGENISSIFEGIIQFRPSGIRVKTPTVFPALVAMVQIPIIGKYRRRLTERECARLQSFPDTFKICSNRHQALKQFGNSVNVNVLQAIFTQLIGKYGPLKSEATHLTPTPDVIPYKVQSDIQLSFAFEERALYASMKKPTLLIGSCRQAQKQWIVDNNLYNYPIEEDEMDKLPMLQRATHLIVRHRKNDVGYYKIKSLEIVDKQGLKEKGYPVKSSSHKGDTRYILYTLNPLKKSAPSISPQDCEIVLGKAAKTTLEG